MSAKMMYIIGGILLLVLFYGYKKGWFSCPGTGGVDVATSCYKQLSAYVNNNPTMTGADIKNNFVANVNCSKL